MKPSLILTHLFLFISIIPLFSGCVSREIISLQESVAHLENRMIDYQASSSQDVAETTSKVTQVNQTVNKAFSDIRYSQSNIGTMIEQLSDRLSKVERDISILQQSTQRIGSFSSESYTTLTERLNGTEESMKDQRRQDLESIQKNLNALAKNIASLTSVQNKNQRSINSLETKLSSVGEENRKIYRQILKELGANVPGEADLSSVEAEDSGKTHKVKSGETLSAIASRLGVSVKAIQKLNGIDNPAHIRIGQVIRIPK
jgi:LysM repeat protein